MVYNNVDDPVTIRRLTPVDNALVLTTTHRTGWGGDVDELPVDDFLVLVLIALALVVPLAWPTDSASDSPVGAQDLAGNGLHLGASVAIEADFFFSKSPEVSNMSSSAK